VPKAAVICHKCSLHMCQWSITFRVQWHLSQSFLGLSRNQHESAASLSKCGHDADGNRDGQFDILFVLRNYEERG
jgi:hypothetical protein